MTVPAQPEQPLRQRLADALRDAAYECGESCDLGEQDCLARHPIQASSWGHGMVIDSVEGDLGALAEVAAAAVQPDLDAKSERNGILVAKVRGLQGDLAKSQQRGDIWKAKAAALEQDRDRLAAERDQFADRVDTLTAVCKSNQQAYKGAVLDCQQADTELAALREQLAAARAEIQRLRAQLAAVTALHEPYRSVYDEGDDRSCVHCNQITSSVVPWPCPTALTAAPRPTT